MKHLILAMLVALAACAPKQTPPPDAADTERAAIELVNEWAAVGSEGRWDDLSALYADAPDFAWVEDGVLAYDSHEAIIAGIQRAHDAGLTIRTQASHVSATALSPDAASVRANVSIAFGEPASGGFAFDGILTAVVVKRDDRWVFLQGHLSSQRPAETQEP